MSVLIKPIITEKMTADSELNNRYGFVVDPKANKLQIKDAIEATYGVSVKNVRTMNYGPSRKSRYTKTGVQHGKTNAYKKAIALNPKLSRAYFNLGVILLIEKDKAGALEQYNTLLSLDKDLAESLKKTIDNS